MGAALAGLEVFAARMGTQRARVRSPSHRTIAAASPGDWPDARFRERSRLPSLYARSWYVPPAVFTRIFSPSLMNGGTCTTRPVSILAALVTLETVAPFRPGSVSITVISTVGGSSTLIAL